MSRVKIRERSFRKQLMKRKDVIKFIRSKLYTERISMIMSKAQIKAYGIIPFAKMTVNYDGEDTTLYIDEVKKNNDGKFTVWFGVPKESAAIIKAWSEDLAGKKLVEGKDDDQAH